MQHWVLLKNFFLLAAMFVSRALDESFQKQFERYLDARGINGELSNYLLDLLEDKQEREYIRWLRNIEFFITK
jgi:complement component 1 Q subcomponent-binding protein